MKGLPEYQHTDLSTFLWLTVSNTFALSLSFISRILYDYLVKFFIIYRQYQSSNGMKMTQSVLDKIMANYWLSDGKIMSDGKMLPHGLIIGKKMRFFASVQISSTKSSDHMSSIKNDKSITVWTWRWDHPIIPDVTASALDDQCEEECDFTREGWVTVTRKNVFGEYSCRKECAEPKKCPTLAASQAMAYDMYKSWLNSDKEGRFIISGLPGCGKSISSRVFAHKVGGTLCPYYNPTKPRVRLDDIIESAQFSRDNPIIIVMEEFDKCLEKFIYADPSMERNMVELGTKSDWTDFLDHLQFRPDIVLIMITNRSYAELDELDKTHFQGALLRPGRITDRFVMH